MDREQGCQNAASRVEALEAAIRKHRDERGEDRCWLSDEELYAALPEGYKTPARTEEVELLNCMQFIRCRHHPGTVYVSPQIKIAELEAEISALRTNYINMAERCGGQSHIITRLIEGHKPNQKIQDDIDRMVNEGGSSDD